MASENNRTAVISNLISGAIQNLGLEIQFVKDFLHPDIQGGEKGLWFCHFYAAYKSLSKA